MRLLVSFKCKQLPLFDDYDFRSRRKDYAIFLNIFNKILNS